MNELSEALKDFFSDGFEPCITEKSITEKKYGMPENICDECVRSGKNGIVTWEEIDVYGFPTPYSYRCKQYPCERFPEILEKKKERIMKDSGIPDEYKEKTVNLYKAIGKGTDKAKGITAKFCTKCNDNQCQDWLYLAGQSGSGKTHLACAAGINLIHCGKTVKMFSWQELMREVKSFEYENFEDAKNVEVLILDDLYKGNPTEEEKKRTFELIDYRKSKRLQTIITTERDNREMNELDSALIGRIVEACSGYWAFIPKSSEVNHRMKDFLK